MNRIRLHDESGTRTSSMANRGQSENLLLSYLEQTSPIMVCSRIDTMQGEGADSHPGKGIFVLYTATVPCDTQERLDAHTRCPNSQATARAPSSTPNTIRRAIPFVDRGAPL